MMLWWIIRFYCLLWHGSLTGAIRTEEIIDSENHAHFRRFREDYKKKRSVVKNFWIFAGIITLLFPFLHVIFGISLLTTFLSFSYLDES